MIWGPTWPNLDQLQFVWAPLCLIPSHHLIWFPMFTAEVPWDPHFQWWNHMKNHLIPKARRHLQLYPADGPGDPDHPQAVPVLAPDAWDILGTAGMVVISYVKKPRKMDILPRKHRFFEEDLRFNRGSLGLNKGLNKQQLGFYQDYPEKMGF